MKRPSIAWAIVLSLVATMAATTSPVATAAPVVAPAAVATQIDLTNPTAGINDPLASMPVLDRNCKAGQTDVNTATAAELMAAFHIDADTAGRMIAGREWLKATDTISVPGVPSSAYQYIRANGCATPITLPPVPVNQCKSGSTALDLQVATQSQLMKIAGLSKTTSLSLIAARPLPDNLHQVAVPVVSGLSDSKITEMLNSGKYCITPAPFTYSVRTWRWATGAFGAIVSAASDSRYSLYIPPGVVYGDGAWAAVSPLPPYAGELPSMDSHIYGAWGGEVAVQLPQVDGFALADQMVLHESEDGPRMSTGTALVAGLADTVLTIHESLSPDTVLVRPAICNSSSYLPTNSLAPCANDVPDFLLSDTYRRIRDYQAKYGGGTPGPCPYTGNPLVVTSGSMHSMICGQPEISSDTATFPWTNSSGNLLYFGNVYRWEGPADAVTQVKSSSKGLFTGPVFDLMSGSSRVLPPKDGLVVRAEQGDGPVKVGAATSSEAMMFWLVSQFTSLFDSVGIVVGAERGAGVLSCLSGLEDVSAADNEARFKQAVQCLVFIGGEIADDALTSGKFKAGSAAAKNIASFKKFTGAFGYVLMAIDLGVSSIQWATELGLDSATHEFLAPPPPVSTGGGAATLSIKGDGKFIAMDGHRAFLVSPPPIPQPLTAEWTAQEIATNDGFNCYAEGYLAIDQVDAYRGNDGREYLRLDHNPVVLVAKAPDCTRGDPRWDYASPVTMAGNTPLGIILKEPDWQGIRSWWVTSTGEIQNIPDGGTYLCLAQRAPVLWNFGKRYAEGWVQPLTDPVTPPVTDSTGPTANCR
ncbi:MAG: hypothetical protein IPM08_14895 [Actinomycetales bacterium]|nr:hypothetical protein [Actinomycetales bacterium]